MILFSLFYGLPALSLIAGELDSRLTLPQIRRHFTPLIINIGSCCTLFAAFLDYVVFLCFIVFILVE